MRAVHQTANRLLAVLSGALALGGCVREEPPKQRRVISRVGGDPYAKVVPNVPIRPLRLDNVSRSAVRLRQRVPLKVRSKGLASEVLFSLAVPGPKAQGVRYRVAVRGDGHGEWRELLSEEVVAGRAAWLDRRVSLGENGMKHPVFRFSAEPTGPAPGKVFSARVGSVRVVGAVSEKDRPNVIIVSLDTLSARYLGYYGNPAPVSPQIDAWLADACTFRRAYAPYGNTLVSHSSLFSALYPKNHRRIEGNRPLPKLDSLVARFAAAGYLTAAFTENAYVSSSLGFGVGFDSYDNGPGKLLRQMTASERKGARQTLREAGDWLRRHRDGPPFFLFVHTYEVHTPYTISGDAARKLADELTPGDTRDLGPRSGGMVVDFNRGRRKLSRRDIDRLRALYQGRIRTLDDSVADLFATIRESGIEQDTIVVVTADHGEQFGEYGKLGHGESMHGSVLQVPLALRWPGVIAPGRLALDVELIDAMPTVLDLAGIPVEREIDGRSLAPFLRRKRSESTPRPSFAEMNAPKPNCSGTVAEECRTSAVAVRLGHWKLIRSSDGPGRRLIDLAADPNETTDVADAHPEERAQLDTLIDRYLGTARRRTSGSVPGGELPDLDDELAERLRALGYLQ